MQSTSFRTHADDTDWHRSDWHVIKFEFCPIKSKPKPGLQSPWSWFVLAKRWRMTPGEARGAEMCHVSSIRLKVIQFPVGRFFRYFRSELGWTIYVTPGRGHLPELCLFTPQPPESGKFCVANEIESYFVMKLLSIRDFFSSDVGGASFLEEFDEGSLTEQQQWQVFFGWWNPRPVVSADVNQRTGWRLVTTHSSCGPQC